MRRSGIVIILIMAGCILAAGCAGYFAEKTTDPIYAQLVGFSDSPVRERPVFPRQAVVRESTDYRGNTKGSCPVNRYPAYIL